MTSNGSASKTRMAISAAGSPRTSGVLGALITLGVVFELPAMLGISVEQFTIAIASVLTLLSAAAVGLKPWLARLTCCVLLFLSACNFTEGVAAASKTLRDIEPGFDKFAVVVRIEVKKALVKTDKQRFLCEHKQPPVNVKKCMGIWWIVDRQYAPKMRRVLEKLPKGAGLGPEALDAVREGVELLAAIDGLRK